MRSPKVFLAISIASSAVSTLVLQLGGMLILAPARYGVFSAIYLLSSFFISLQVAIVSEAWVRGQRLLGVNPSLRSYDTAAFWMSCIAFGGGTVIALVFSESRGVWLLSGLAFAFSAYWSAARFRALRNQRWRYVIPGDLFSAVSSSLAITFAWKLQSFNLEIMIAGWALSMGGACLLSGRISLGSPRMLANWIRQLGPAVRPLLRDSLLMEASSVGTPYVLLPILGVSSFGTYRAVSNVSAPVRLTLNPLRPQFARVSKEKLASTQTMALVVGCSVLFGLGAWVALFGVAQLNVELGTLTSVTAHRDPTALFVASSFLGHSHYLFARQNARSRDLLHARLVQTLLAIIGPCLGVWVAGLAGAIWGFAAATTMSAMFWMLTTVRAARQSS